MLTLVRKQELSELADIISNSHFLEGQIINPEYIAEQNEITYSYGQYGNSFDGLLEHRSGAFHIYINLDRLERKDTPRARFTFAHELGHFYIDEHRNALRKGKTPYHPSFNRLVTGNPAEREADYFASCLLMPEQHVRNLCLRRPLSSRLLENISVRYKTSISSVIFRYFELDLFPMCIVMMEAGKVVWAQRSSDFWNGDLPKKGAWVSKTTAAGEYFKNQIRHDTEQIVYGDDWFRGWGANKDQQFFEKCYYMTPTKVLSVIWRKESR